MTTSIHLCGEREAARLADLMVRARAEAGQDVTVETLVDLIAPLLAGTAQGAAWLFGPTKAPTGYVVLSFRYSVAEGGTVATVEEIFVRPAIRRRGIATEVLLALSKALSDGGITALSADFDSDILHRLATRAGLTERRGLTRATRRL